MILLATQVLDGRPDQRPLGAIDLAVRRNGYGRQAASFECDLDGGRRSARRRCHAVFIRAPWSNGSVPPSRCWPRSRLGAGRRRASRWSAAKAGARDRVPPGADRDRRLHRLFLEMTKDDDRTAMHHG